MQWCHEFNKQYKGNFHCNGNTKVNDEKMSGRPTVLTDDLVEQVNAKVQETSTS